MASRRALAIFPVIAGLILALYAACLALTLLLAIPWDLGLPWPVRLLGLPFLAYGLVMIGWTVRFRGPWNVVESTWATFLKLARRVPIEVAAGRTEPLVVAGPYRHVRHPLYSGVDGLTVGIALLVDHPWAYLGALALGLWFAIVLAPFEERELVALFGAPYTEYMRSVRRFLPVGRRAQ